MGCVDMDGTFLAGLSMISISLSEFVSGDASISRCRLVAGSAVATGSMALNGLVLAVSFRFLVGILAPSQMAAVMSHSSHAD